MDQLKHYLRILKRQHFWVVSVMVVLLGIVAWFLTVRSLASERDEFQSSIASSYSTVQSVRSKQDHVNQHTLDQMKQLIEERRLEVQAAWDRKFKQQTGGEEGENILQWPEELSPEFHRAVANFRPIETNATFPVPAVDRDIATNLRENYRDYIRDELPKLAERIGAVWSVETEGFSRSRGGGEGEEESRGFGGDSGSRRDGATIVYWNPEDQQFIQNNHFDWSTGYGKRPSSLQVLYAQEDLWVLTALVEIIKRTNGNATVRHNAAVKEIQSIRIGKHAGGLRGKIRQDAATGVGSDEDSEGSGVDERDWNEREESSAEEGEGEEAQIDPAEGRYVDKNYQQLGGFLELQGSLTSEVAKRMPVRMRVRMDQRAINKLLVQCANSPLTVEVRQVRVNPQDGSTERSGGGTGLLRGRLGGEADFEGRGGLFNARGPAGPDFGVDDAFPYDVTVEIYGIIYIYNPVDESTLGEGADPDASYAAISR
jgi:hypothetical protein